MKETVRDLFKIAEGLYGRIGKQPVHPLVLNIALLRQFANQSHTESQERISAIDSTSTVTEKFAAEVLHYFNYASEVYGTDPLIRKQDIVLNQLEEDTTMHLPRHIVFLDHLTKSIVVSIRGTKSISDMITDLYIQESPFLASSTDRHHRGIVAHRGIAQSAEALLPSVTEAIREVQARRGQGGRCLYADYRVVTTGHSLGAGTAALLSMLLSTQSQIPVTTFAFAPPPVISHPTLPKAGFPLSLFKREVACQIHSFVHDRDFISRCSHLELLHMLASLTAVDSLPWTDFDRAVAVLRGRLNEQEMCEIAAVLRKAKEGFVGGKDAALYLPGDICLLRPTVREEHVPAVAVLPNGNGDDLSKIDAEGKKECEKDTPTTSKWQQLVERTSRLRAVVAEAEQSKANAELAHRADGDHKAGGDEIEGGGEEGSERRNPDPRTQYELVRVPSAESMFNGLLYCGDSMVHDHLLTSYRKALLKLVT